jgi:hypothetical protein
MPGSVAALSSSSSLSSARRALRARPIKLAFELLDHQLLMRDQGRIIGSLGSDLRQLGFYLQQGCLQRVHVIRRLGRIACHRRTGVNLTSNVSARDDECRGWYVSLGRSRVNCGSSRSHRG